LLAADTNPITDTTNDTSYHFYNETIDTLILKLCQILTKVNKIDKDVLINILYHYPLDIFQSCIIKSLHNQLNKYVKIENGRGSHVPYLCITLKMLYDVNEMKYNKVSSLIFCNEGINNIPLDALASDMFRCKQYDSNIVNNMNRLSLNSNENMFPNKPFFLFDYSFLYTTQTKQLLILVESNVSQQQAQQSTIMMSFFTRNQVLPFLVLLIDRKNILQSTMSQLQSIQDMDLRKPLKVCIHVSIYLLYVI
jgi:hypothetical protein